MADNDKEKLPWWKRLLKVQIPLWPIMTGGAIQGKRLDVYISDSSMADNDRKRVVGVFY